MAGRLGMAPGPTAMSEGESERARVERERGEREQGWEHWTYPDVEQQSLFHGCLWIVVGVVFGVLAWGMIALAVLF